MSVCVHILGTTRRVCAICDKPAGDFVDIQETVRRLRADLGEEVDFARVRVMARDLRVALAWIERNTDFIERQLIAPLPPEMRQD